MTPEELKLICRVWQDNGSDDPTGQWLELWDGGQSDDYPDERDAILASATACGLPAEMTARRVLRLRKTQQLNDEILSNYR
jgi:hypothetical protein